LGFALDGERERKILLSITVRPLSHFVPRAAIVCSEPPNTCGACPDGEQCVDGFCASGRIAYVSDASGKYEVWTMYDNGKGVDQLTDGAPGTSRRDGAHSPRWSPDGTKIAFLYKAGEPTPSDTRVMVVDVATKEPSEIRGDPRPFSIWACDACVPWRR
jgi:hypothetical protein